MIAIPGSNAVVQLRNENGESFEVDASTVYWVILWSQFFYVCLMLNFFLLLQPTAAPAEIPFRCRHVDG